jgi:predicted DNA-binding antitoxin AbrB/MazE fold protein
VKTTIDAVFQDGVFKPCQDLPLADGTRVRLTAETAEPSTPEDILALAARVYDGLSPADVDEIEEMARRRPLFTKRRA